MTLSLPQDKVFDKKGSGSQGGLLLHMQGCDEDAGFDKLCQHGTTTGKITLSSPIVLATGELQNSSEPVQRSEPRPIGFPVLTLVMHLHATTKVNKQTFSRGGSDNRCFQRGLWRSHEQSVLQGQVACIKGHKHPHQYPG